MDRKKPIYHPIAKPYQIYITRKNPSRYCKRAIVCLKKYPEVELYATGAAINTLCQIKMEIEKMIYLPIEIPTLLCKIHCNIYTFTIQQDKMLNGMKLVLSRH